MATADPIPPAILSYVTSSVYPDSESISSSTLTPSTLSNLLLSLRAEQEKAQSSIRSLSRDTAPDIDSWISHAKSLQADILRSRDLAREIVADAEKGREVKDEVEDSGSKVKLLEREVQFNEHLQTALEDANEVNELLEKAAEQAVTADVLNSFETMRGAEERTDDLEGRMGPRAVEVLRQKREGLKRGMAETTTECWDGLVQVSVEERWMRVQKHGIDANVPDAVVQELDLETVVWGLKALGIFDGVVQKLAKDIERALLRPRMNVDEDEQVAKVEVKHGKCSCCGKSSDLSTKGLFEDLRRITDFLNSKLPATVIEPLSAELVSALAARLENQWLDPAVPTAIEGIPEFQDLLADLEAFTDYLEGQGWSGTRPLREWAEQAPRAWLTKRREVVLGDARNLVFGGLRERKTVERVETRVVSKEEMGMTATQGEDDDWDAAWDDPEESKPSAPEPVVEPAKSEDEDDEASAWDIEDDDYRSNKDNASTNGDDEKDAWGWGDDDQKSQPSSPVATKKSQPTASNSPSKPNGNSPQEQSLTLRETFTVTSIPDGILSILQSTISDAQTLAGPQYTSSPFAPAAAALYTLPTLALAIYRATAPTAYAKVDGLGNMLIYNDASRLSDQLRNWQSSQPPSSRLKMDSDLTALEVFAKRAYVAEMDAQRTILIDLLDGAQGFVGCTQFPQKSQCEGAVEGAVARLRDVHAMWKPILSSGALLQSLGSLLNTATTKMITEIEDLGDISEPESQQLKQLCETVLSVRDIFTQPPEGDTGEGKDMSFIYCPTWLKFQYLAEILESSMADIRWMWKEGELSLEFAGEEVVELIEALFAESGLRREAVREVRGR
ncbi:ribosome biogenesis protein ytm1 [Saxophila tyrrhenica]|uniref:Ribosome biogenesis protein ytm1 n=1 Tax=Saxophila tyrrhenica TaxID=1690608 RepID=A0AAV9NYZ1_9PEZI|nr:ribosome biogenesis protein ytm1 [Saxophila tyrrhenica]